MWMDHITLAVHDLAVLDRSLSDMGLARHPAPPLLAGTTRSVVPLIDSFIELLAVSDRRTVRNVTLGQALLRFLSGGEGIFRVVVGVEELDRFMRARQAVGAHFWPPIAETLTFPGENAVPILLTQMDLMLPWVMQYQGMRPDTNHSAGRLARVVVQSADPAITASHYRMALGRPIDGDPPGGSLTMQMDNGCFHFERGVSPGFSGLLIHHANRALRVDTEQGTISGRVAAL